MAITLYVESTAIDTVLMQWEDDTNPGNTHQVHRSDDGISFVLVDTAEAGDTTFTDSGLPPQTRFWYKIIEGSNESNVASVVTQACAPSSSRNAPGAALPDAEDDIVDRDTFNAAMRQLEAILRGQIDVGEYQKCVVCIENGAVILNCLDGCKDFVIDVVEDINSISIIGCVETEGSITFEIPPNTTRRICGFPNGFGFTSGECRDAPFTSGDSGATLGLGFGPGPAAKSPSGSRSGLGGSGGGGIPEGSELTMKCLTVDGDENDPCSLDCSDAKEARFRITGGRPPYNVTTNSGGTITEISAGIYSLVPHPNPGSAVAGSAYKIAKWHRDCNDGLNAMHLGIFSCDDVSGGNVIAASCAHNFLSDEPTCSHCTGAMDIAMPILSHGGTSGCNTGGTYDIGGGGICDMRTSGMIASGCLPCALMTEGKTITVEDADGVSYVIVLHR